MIILEHSKFTLFDKCETVSLSHSHIESPIFFFFSLKCKHCLTLSIVSFIFKRTQSKVHKSHTHSLIHDQTLNIVTKTLSIMTKHLALWPNPEYHYQTLNIVTKTQASWPNPEHHESSLKIYLLVWIKAIFLHACYKFFEKVHWLSWKNGET